MNLKIRVLSILVFISGTIYCSAQQGRIEVNQDEKIGVLLNLKKEMNKNDNDSDRYKIQLYSGNRSEAENVQSEFNEYFTSWHSSLQYETPNFKIWTGNFRTRLEADRALQKIKLKFPSAFIFKPKKSY